MPFAPLTSTIAAALSAAVVGSPHAAVRPAAIRAVSWHGGPQRTGTGEVVTVYVSDSYADGDLAARWAGFLAGLVHGSELQALTAYVAPAAELEALCGSAEAAGCYGGNRLVFDGTDELGIRPEAIAAHEYGHHVAANRQNLPWRALDWGPKHWASQVGVCARAAGGTAFPGDEGDRYTLNPGEGFAETYRVLNGMSTGIEPDWPIIDPSFRPESTALEAARRDVLEPWRAATTQTVVHRFRAAEPRTWTTRIATPLDGDVTVQLSYPVAASFGATAIAPDRHVLAGAAQTGTGRRELSFQACGQRSFELRIARQRAAGSVRVRITTP